MRAKTWGPLGIARSVLPDAQSGVFFRSPAPCVSTLDVACPLDPPLTEAKAILMKLKSQHITTFCINCSRKLGVEENIFNLEKAKFPKHVVNTTLSGETLKSEARMPINITTV